MGQNIDPEADLSDIMPLLFSSNKEDFGNVDIVLAPDRESHEGILGLTSKGSSLQSD